MRPTALFLLGFLLCLPLETSAEFNPPLLNVQVDETGTARVTAVLEFPGTPVAIRALLMDYRRWPALFPHGLRVAAAKLENGSVVTDLYVSRYFLPGEWHLITETRESEPGRLETRLIEGDFLRYHRVWQLSSVNQARPSKDAGQAGSSPGNRTPPSEVMNPSSARRDMATDPPPVGAVSAGGTGKTRAKLEMEVQPKMWVPRWMFTIILKRELTEHFAKLQEEAAAPARP
jgi:hypothetical protein